MQSFLNSKLATAVTLAIVLGAIVVVMRMSAQHPLEWGAATVALLGSVALSLARGLAQPPPSEHTITKKEEETTKP